MIRYVVAAGRSVLARCARESVAGPGSLVRAADAAVARSFPVARPPVASVFVTGARSSVASLRVRTVAMPFPVALLPVRFADAEVARSPVAQLRARFADAAVAMSFPFASL